MSKDFFKVKKGLHIKPSDPSTLTDLEDGDIIVDSTDNQLKKYSEEDGEFATIAGSGGAVANFFSDFDKLTPTLVNVQNDVVLDDAVVFLPIDDNKKSKKITYTAAGSALYEVAASADLEGAQGLMTIWIKTDVQGVTVSTTTDGVKQSTLSVLATGKWKQYEIPYIVGGTNQGLIVESANTGDVNIDEPFVGLAPAGYIQDVGQAQFVGSLTYNVANCIWVTTSVTYDSFPVDTDCVASNVIGNITAPNTKIPGIKITNARTDGFYKVTYDGLFYISNQTGACLFSLSSTGSFDNQAVNYIEGSDRISNSLNGNFRFSTTGDKEVEIVGYRSGGTGGECLVYGNNLVSGTFAVHFFPDASSTIVTQDAELISEVLTDNTDQTGLASNTNHLVDGISYTVVKSGKYKINVASTLKSGNLGFFQAFVNVNGLNVSPSNTANKGNANWISATNVFTGDLVVGDVVRLNLFFNTGTTETIGFSYMSIQEIPKDVKVIGKFEQIEEVKADLTAATANEFSAYINDNGNLISENYDWINGNCANTSTGNFNCTFNAGLFSEKPSCVVSARNSGVQANAQINTITVNNVTVTTLRTDTNALANLEFKLHCSKQGADVNKSFVGAIINASQSAQEIADIVRTDIVSSDLVVVEAFGNGGQFIAANSGKIVFNETKDNQNAWSNNNLFTAPKDGYYLVNGSVFTTAVTSARIESYIDNIKSKLVAEPDSGTTLLKISSIEYLTAGQTLDFRPSINITLSSSNNAFHNITIQQLPDTESIVKNLLSESSQTKCQTKLLTSNVNSNGTYLSFSNLDTSKKYSLSGNLVQANTAITVVKYGTTEIGYFENNTGGNMSQGVAIDVFQPTSTTLEIARNAGGTVFGSATRNRTNFTLCQLPDTFVDTDEW